MNTNRNMAPPYRTDPSHTLSPTLAALVRAGPLVFGSIGGRDVRLYQLPETSLPTPTFVCLCLFSLNQSQPEMYLLDPAVTFDALCSAMNEPLPSSTGSLVASHCLRLISYSAPQFAAFIGFLTRDKSIFQDLCGPEDSPPDITYTLFTLDVPSFLLSVCPSELDLRPRIAELHCAAKFAIKLPQHAQKIHGPAEEGSDDAVLWKQLRIMSAMEQQNQPCLSKIPTQTSISQPFPYRSHHNRASVFIHLPWLRFLHRRCCLLHHSIWSCSAPSCPRR